MSRYLAWTFAGILMAFGVLFLTVWSTSPDAMSMVAVMFACASVFMAVSDTSGRKGACKDAGQDENPRA